jgi:hypothetical protein
METPTSFSRSRNKFPPGKDDWAPPASLGKFLQIWRYDSKWIQFTSIYHPIFISYIYVYIYNITIQLYHMYIYICNHFVCLGNHDIWYRTGAAMTRNMARSESWRERRDGRRPRRTNDEDVNSTIVLLVYRDINIYIYIYVYNIIYICIYNILYIYMYIILYIYVYIILYICIYNIIYIILDR